MYLKVLLALATAAALCFGGFTVGQAFSQAEIDLLEERLRDRDAEIKELEAAISQEDIAVSTRIERRPDEQTISGSDPSSTSRHVAETFEAMVSKGLKVPLFQGALTVTLEDLIFQHENDAYEAQFVLKSPGTESKQVTLRPGTSTDFRNYEVELVETQPFKAKFRVSRMSG